MLGGALATIAALPRVAPIVHASQGCGGNLFSAAFAGSGYYGSGYCSGNSVSSSGLLEKDIVFGGTDRLDEQIRTTFEVIDADLFIVTTSCMSEIIGDDIRGVTNSFNETGENPPLFYIETAGFSGNSYKGYERVIGGLFEYFIKPVAQKNPKLVNIFGIVPSYDPFFRGELEEIQRLLSALGLEVNTFFTPDQTIDNIKAAGEAALNITFSSVYGISELEAVKISHGIPYEIFDLPVGAQATRDFLVRLSELLPVQENVLKKTLDREFERYYAYVEHTLDLYADSDFQFYAVLVSNANRAVSFTKYLIDEIGWIGKYVFITDELDEDQKQALQDRFNGYHFSTQPELIFETDGEKIIKYFTKQFPQFVSDRYFDAFSPAYILGSSLEKDFAGIIGANLLTVSFPITDRLIVGRGYAGFNGGLALLEDLIGKVISVR
jgi:nitrogenase molybdenum-iron protein beta chain